MSRGIRREDMLAVQLVPDPALYRIPLRIDPFKNVSRGLWPTLIRKSNRSTSLVLTCFLLSWMDDHPLQSLPLNSPLVVLLSIHLLALTPHLGLEHSHRRLLQSPSPRRLRSSTTCHRSLSKPLTILVTSIWTTATIHLNFTPMNWPSCGTFWGRHPSVSSTSLKTTTRTPLSNSPDRILVFPPLGRRLIR